MGALASPSFRWLVISSTAAYLGTGMQLTAVAWLALSAPGGAFTVGLVLAARMLPNLLFGLASGTLADHADRQSLLLIVRILAVLPALGLAWLAMADSPSVWPLVALSFATGAVNVFDTPTRQALVMDTTPRELAPNAMALNATSTRVCTAVGALAAGVLIPAASVMACFVATIVVFVLAAALSVLVRPAHRTRVARHRTRPTFTQALGEAVTLVFRLPEVRTLVLAAVACEIFAFSYQTAVPVFARDVLGAGAEGLGTLTAAASFGGAAALVLLAMVPSRIPRRPVLGAVFVVYGASMLALAPTTNLFAASAALVVTGACAASFDMLQQTLLQLAVSEDQRGRAVGLWVLGIGSAPLGNLEMGALVAFLGAPAALAINGTLVLVAAALLILLAPAYRRVLTREPLVGGGSSG
jgi:MFS family permease